MNSKRSNSSDENILINEIVIGDNMTIETDRLILREYTMADFDALYQIMSDAQTMQHYPAPFDEERTRR